MPGITLVRLVAERLHKATKICDQTILNEVMGWCKGWVDGVGDWGSPSVNACLTEDIDKMALTFMAF